MALTYEQSAELMKNAIFIGRIKVACLKFASFIYGEASTVPAHSTRIRWAQQTFTMPDASASQATPTTVMDPAVQAADLDADGDSAITDTALQSAVENSVNKML
jgi:hypothetical protein